MSNEQVHQDNNLMEDLFSICFETEKVHIIAIISTSPHPAMPEPLMPSSCSFFIGVEINSRPVSSSLVKQFTTSVDELPEHDRLRETSLPMDIQRRQPSLQLVCIRFSSLN